MLEHSIFIKGPIDPVWLQKSSLKVYVFSFFLPLKQALGAAFNETGGCTYRKYGAEQSLIMPNFSETLQ